MSLVNLSVKHGRTLEEARGRLETVVEQVTRQFGALIQRTEWTDDRNRVTLTGTGFKIALQVDEQEVHLTVDIPILANLLANPLVNQLRTTVEQTFQKRLT